MKLKTKSVEPAAKAPALDIQQIHDRIVALRARDRELLAEQIELEGNGGEGSSAPSPVGDVGLIVERLVAGDVENLPHAGPPAPPRIVSVLQQRTAIEKAIERLGRDASDLYHARAQANWQRRATEWNELLRETAMTICKLQKLNRTRAQMAKEIRAKTMITLPGEFPNDLVITGKGYANDGPHAFLEMTTRLGIVTPGEIARERGDTPERF